MMTAKHIFFRGGLVQLNHQPAAKILGHPVPLSEGFNLDKGAPRSDIAEFGVGSVPTGEKKNNNEKGTGEKSETDG